MYQTLSIQKRDGVQWENTEGGRQKNKVYHWNKPPWCRCGRMPSKLGEGGEELPPCATSPPAFGMFPAVWHSLGVVVSGRGGAKRVADFPRPADWSTRTGWASTQMYFQLGRQSKRPSSAVRSTHPRRSVGQALQYRLTYSAARGAGHDEHVDSLEKLNGFEVPNGTLFGEFFRQFRIAVSNITHHSTFSFCWMRGASLLKNVREGNQSEGGADFHPPVGRTTPGTPVVNFNWLTPIPFTGEK